MAATTLSSMIMPQRAAICTAGFAARATHCARPGGVRSVSLVRSSIFHTTGRGTVTVPRAVADPGKEGSATLPMELTGATSAVVSDEAVPEGHKCVITPPISPSTCASLQSGMIPRDPACDLLVWSMLPTVPSIELI